jgi:hypothetical protein
MIVFCQAGPVGPIEGPDPKVMEFLRILEEYRYLLISNYNLFVYINATHRSEAA